MGLWIFLGAVVVFIGFVMWNARGRSGGVDARSATRDSLTRGAQRIDRLYERRRDD